MCDLCDNDIKVYESARDNCRNTANLLRRLADRYDGLADGRIKPHGRDAKNIGYLAVRIIKYLTEEWL